MKQAIQLVVFDIAGTTVKDDGAIAACFMEALESFGYHVPAERINPLMGYKKTEAIRTLLMQENAGKETGLELVSAIHERFMELMVTYYAQVEQLEALPHAEEVFEWLKAHNIRVGLDTGFPHRITEVIMKRMRWLALGLVDDVISSDEVPAGRPAPYMIQDLMRRGRIHDARKVMKVGDTEVDIQEGKNAGCLYSIGVTTGAFRRAALEPYGPAFILDSLSELLSIIEQVRYAGIKSV